MSIRRNRAPIVAVCGGSEATPAYLEVAEAAGEAIAREGWLLICGGLSAVMEAASRGAKRAGGTTIGLLPGTDVTAANDFIDIPIATGIGYMRNAAITTTADAIVAIDGKEGTLSEMCYALVYHKPVIVIDLDEGPVDMGGIRVDKAASPGLVVVRDVASAIARIKAALRLG